ncbi:MAG: metallophosphoesterase [Bacteroidota bacterium]|nr:metallophosphoesterase [Bacteroidota bacterium]
MKTNAFLVFFITVFILYGLLNTYIYLRGLHCLPSRFGWRLSYTIAFWILSASFILARILGRISPGNVSEVISWIGSFWLAAMFYFFLIALLVDLVRLSDHFFHFLPGILYKEAGTLRITVFLTSYILVVILIVAGFINARSPRIHYLNLKIDKKVENTRSMRIVMASDIHLGTLVASRRSAYLVNHINSLKPDLILFAGDLVDEDLEPVIRKNLGNTLSNLKAKYGVYAVTGNHEYIGGVEKAAKYLSSHGISILRDTSVFVGNGVWLIGREDRAKKFYTGKERKSLNELMGNIDRSHPVILMDHQPFHLEKAAAAGVDLQLSGHTHHGQIWPLNYITKAMYELSWGYKRIGKTHYYVSSGFGTWGPPVRIGNRPEIVVITLEFLK